MKTSYFYLFNLSDASSIPSIIFENASPNHTWVLTNEYSQGAFCEFDSCHLELPPIFNTENDIRQDVAFSNYNGTEIFTYDVCNSAGASSVIYTHDPHTPYQCTEYSGGKILVRVTPTNVTADPINNSVQAIHIKETVPRVYAINVTLFPQIVNNKTSFSNNIPFILACTLGTLGVCFILLCMRYCLNKHMPNMNLIGKNIHGLFTRAPEKRALMAMEHMAQNNDHNVINDARVYL